VPAVYRSSHAFASLIRIVPASFGLSSRFSSPHAWSAPRKFWRATRTDLQIVLASLIITGLLVQRIAIYRLRYGVQIFVIEELHG
jgi:hypothetical protein